MTENPISTPVKKQETPSAAGINWKLFLLVAGIIGIAFFAGMAMQSNGNSANSVDVSNPTDIGQSIGPNNPPVAVETETPNEETDRINSFWYKMEDTEEDAKPVATEKEDTSELTEMEEIGYTHTYYPVDNIPKILKAPGDLSHSGFQDIYFTNLRREDGRFKFCVENRGNTYYGYVGAIHVRIRVGGTWCVLDTFTEVTVPPGEKRCFATTDAGANLGLAESTNKVLLYLPHL